MRPIRTLFTAMILACVLGSTVLIADTYRFFGCTRDNHTVALAVDFEPVTDHDVAQHISTAFIAMAKQFTVDTVNSPESFKAFVAGLDEVDKDAFTSFPEGPPRVVADSCKE